MFDVDTLELVDGVVELGLHGCGPRDAHRRSENVRGWESCLCRRVSACRVPGRVTYFNADRTINTFVVATEAMFCAELQTWCWWSPLSSSPPGSLLSFHWFWSTDKLLWTNTRIKSLICHTPHPPPDIQYANSVSPHSFQCLLSPPGLISTLQHVV